MSFCVFTAVKTVIVNPLPSQINAIKGIDAILPCGVQKDPDIIVTWHWTKDGSAVDVSRMKVQNNGALRILTVQENDAGTYTCRVESVAGKASTTGQLSVLGTHADLHLPLFEETALLDFYLREFHIVVGQVAYKVSLCIIGRDKHVLNFPDAVSVVCEKTRI